MWNNYRRHRITFASDHTIYKYIGNECTYFQWSTRRDHHMPGGSFCTSFMVKSLASSDTYILHKTTPSFVHIMACCLFATEHLDEPTTAWCYLIVLRYDSHEHIITFRYGIIRLKQKLHMPQECDELGLAAYLARLAPWICLVDDWRRQMCDCCVEDVSVLPRTVMEEQTACPVLNTSWTC